MYKNNVEREFNIFSLGKEFKLKQEEEDILIIFHY